MLPGIGNKNGIGVYSVEILFSDNFTGTTIDTSKWIETDPGSVLYQNNKIIRVGWNATFLTNNLKSVTTVSRGEVVIQGLLDMYSDGYFTGNTSSIIMYKDDNNYAAATMYGGGGGFNIYAKVVTSGTVRYNYATGLGRNNDIKIWTDGTDIKFYYWNTNTWTQLGTTQTYSLGYPLLYAITGTSGGNQADTNVDNAYMTNGEYLTQYPI